MQKHVCSVYRCLHTFHELYRHMNSVHTLFNCPFPQSRIPASIENFNKASCLSKYDLSDVARDIAYLLFRRRQLGSPAIFMRET